MTARGRKAKKPSKVKTNEPSTSEIAENMNQLNVQNVNSPMQVDQNNPFEDVSSESDEGVPPLENEIVENDNTGNNVDNDSVAQRIESMRQEAENEEQAEEQLGQVEAEEEIRNKYAGAFSDSEPPSVDNRSIDTNEANDLLNATPARNVCSTPNNNVLNNSATHAQYVTDLETKLARAESELCDAMATILHHQRREQILDGQHATHRREIASLKKNIEVLTGVADKAKAKIDRWKELLQKCKCGIQKQGNLSSSKPPSIVEKEIDFVTNTADWVIYNPAQPETRDRIDDLYNDFNDWSFNTVKSTAKDNNVNRDLVNSDGINNLIQRPRINDMMRGEWVLASKIFRVQSKPALTKYSTKPERNPLYKDANTSSQIKKGVLNALCGQTLWPTEALAKILKFYTLESNLASTDKELYDTIFVLCHTAMANYEFSQYTADRNGQIDFIAHCPNDVRLFGVDTIVEKLMDKMLQLSETKRTIYPTVLYQWDMTSDTAFLQVRLSPTCPNVTRARDTLQRVAEFNERNKWHVGRRPETTEDGQMSMSHFNRRARENNSGRNQNNRGRKRSSNAQNNGYNNTKFSR